MKYYIGKINKLLAELCGWLLVAMIILTVVDIVSRFIKRPIQGVSEIAVFVMIIVVYLGLANCEERNEHVKVELIVSRLKGKFDKITKLLTFLIEATITFIIVYAVWKNFLISYRIKEALTGTVPLLIWPVKLLLLIGLLFFLFQILVNFLFNHHKTNE